MKRRSGFVLVVCLAAIVAGVVLLLLHEPEPSSHTVCVGSVGNAGTWALVHSYGTEKGIFDRYGLNVTYVQFSDVYTAMIALLTGEVDVCTPSPGHAATALSEGEVFRIGMVMGLASNMMLLVKPDIVDAPSLRGKRVGVVGTTSDSYYVVKWYLEGKGVMLGVDAEVVEIKNPANLVGGFTTGQLDAVVLWSGFAATVMDSGGVPLVCLSDAGEEVFGHAAYVPVIAFKEDLLERREVLDDFLRAVRETSAEIMANKNEAAEILADFSAEDVDKVRKVLEMTTLVSDLDEEIQNGLVAFSEHAVQDGYLEEAFDESVFYDEWR